MLHEVMEQQTLNIAKTGIISRLATGLHCLRRGQLLADADGPGLPVPHQAYVDIRRVGSSGGQITMQSLQLESLILLAEANAKMRFSALVELPDVEAWRLNCETHREATTDPTPGHVDISTLTMSLSAAGRGRRQEVAAALRRFDISTLTTSLSAAGCDRRWEVTAALRKMIDITTLTASISAADCERRREVAAALRKIDLHHHPDYEPLGGRPRPMPGGGRRAGEDGSASPPW